MTYKTGGAAAAVGRGQWDGGSGVAPVGRRQWGGGSGAAAAVGRRRQWGGGGSGAAAAVGRRRQWGGGSGSGAAAAVGRRRQWIPVGRRQWGGVSGAASVGRRQWDGGSRVVFKKPPSPPHTWSTPVTTTLLFQNTPSQLLSSKLQLFVEGIPNCNPTFLTG
uniref:Uncharacterized protein n=1 Tax=Branchiostoma floridae TaxID=7739 RepID=C3Y4S1_BRAFL|eukprot:XP_002608718.1 hypothetical protein BRAFLDRAFT_73939 [Branchiostoma floridae]